MKTHHRLGFARLAEALAESGLVDQKALKEALQYSSTVGTPFPEAVVEANLVTDWDLSRVVCELYGLPFLPVEIVDPDPAAFQGLDLLYLRENHLIPLGRFGQVLTICMPGLVEADTLGLLAAQCDLVILPVVGTVRSNRHWMEMNIEMPSLPASPEEAATMTTGWSSFFDEADAQVLMELQSTVDEELADVLGGDPGAAMGEAVGEVDEELAAALAEGEPKDDEGALDATPDVAELPPALPGKPAPPADGLSVLDEPEEKAGSLELPRIEPPKAG